MTDNRQLGSTASASLNRQMTYPALMLVLAMFCLSTNHVIGRWTHEEVPPIALGFWRYVFALLFMLPLIWPNRRHWFSIYRRNAGYFVLISTLMALSSTSILVALHFTTATNAAMINSVQTIIIVLLAWVFLKESLRWLQKFGIFVTFGGVMVMLTQGSWEKLTAFQFNPGDLLILAAMFGLATYSILVRRLPIELTPLETVFTIVLLGTAILLPFYIIETIIYRPVTFNTISIYSILAMALIPVLLGMLSLNIGIQMLGPAISAVFLNLIPVFGAILSILFLGEKFYLYHFLSLTTIFVGMLLVLGRNLKRAYSERT